MLYHLTQTAVGKDITLHVSANNPALLLYQEGNELSLSWIQDPAFQVYPDPDQGF
jgi:hypothetical protein